MDEQFQMLFAAFGVEFGVRAFQGPPGAMAKETASERVVECSALQAACVFQALGVVDLVDPATFGRIVGILAGSTSTLVRELTGHPIPLTASSVPDARGICARAFNTMKAQGSL